VSGSLLGLASLTAPSPDLHGPPEIPLENLAFDTLDQHASRFLPLSAKQPGIVPDAAPSATALATIAATVADAGIITQRNALFAALAGFGYDPGQNGPTGDLAGNVNLNYPDAPMIGAPWASTIGGADA
jgi:hypothetical protein